jgi:hypothetical protein
MPDDAKRRVARKAVRAAQERYQAEAEAARLARREVFAEAQRAGLSLREIAEEVGLHRSRVGQIIKGE